jgi:hypothetical protein
MQSWQQLIILVYALLNLGVFLKGYDECKFRKNAYGLTPHLILLGVIAWGDAVIFGPFWIVASLTSYLLNDWYLFLLIISVFWMVRRLGETIYWFNQQFSTINRNPPKKLPFHYIFHNDSIWYVHQIFWQCVTVVSIIFTIYFAKLWLDTRF